MFRYVFYCDEWPGKLIYSSDYFEPCCLFGETCGIMYVPDDRFDTRQLLDILVGINWLIGRHDGLYMIDDVVGCWYFI